MVNFQVANFINSQPYRGVLKGIDECRFDNDKDFIIKSIFAYIGSITCFFILQYIVIDVLLELTVAGSYYRMSGVTLITC